MAERRNIHFRELPSVPFVEHKLPDEFVLFVKKRILPKLMLEGYKIPEKQRIAGQCVNNLILSGMVKAVIGDTRAKSNNVQLRVAVWDAIVEAGFARVCLGSESSGVQTRYRATKTLLLMRKEWELRLVVDLTLERNTELDQPTDQALVVLHTGKIDLSTGEPLPEERKKKPIHFREQINAIAQPGPNGQPSPEAVENSMNYFRAIEDVIEGINRSNLSHGWQAFQEIDGRQQAFQPNPCLRQIHVGRFFRAVRLYSWSQWSGQNLSKEVRQGMLIDGEPVVELDFSGMAPRMLYHLARIDAKGDIYRPKKIMPKFHGYQNATKQQKALVRELIKRATNICLNTTTRAKAIGAVRGWLAEQEQCKTLTKIIERTENATIATIIDRIVEVHEPVRHHFFSEYGLELMSIDGKIMLQILSAFAAAKKPALGIHDSVLCRVSDAEFARETMHECYRRFFQFDPVIKRTF